LKIKDSLNSNIRLLTFELILKPFNNILKTVIIKSETVKSNTYKVILNYNNDIIVVNIREVSNETNDLRLYKYTRFI
jgi:hypothetical protein